MQPKSVVYGAVQLVRGKSSKSISDINKVCNYIIPNYVCPVVGFGLSRKVRDIQVVLNGSFCLGWFGLVWFSGYFGWDQYFLVSRFKRKVSKRKTFISEPVVHFTKHHSPLFKK